MRSRTETFPRHTASQQTEKYFVDKKAIRLEQLSKMRLAALSHDSKTSRLVLAIVCRGHPRREVSSSEKSASSSVPRLIRSVSTFSRLSAIAALFSFAAESR